MSAGEDGFWIFGYGSLMWDPGFVHEEAHAALLRGYHRSLCILSVVNRGTCERPGLALGLDRGGSCRGIAFRIDAERIDATRAYLWQREMSNHAYQARTLPVCLLGGGAATDRGRRIASLVFVARHDHPQYMGDLTPEQAARLVVQGEGLYGTALDYLRNTIAHLDAFGIADGPLHRVLAQAEVLATAEAS